MTKIQLSKVITLAGKILSDQKKVSFKNLDYKAMNEGLKISRQAMTQPEDISLTPYSKNALMKLDRKEYLYVNDPVSNMEKYYERETLRLLKKYCGEEVLSYNQELDPWSPQHYNVDCWRNFKRGNDVRHVEKGMNIEREKNFAKFYSPMVEQSFEQLIGKEKSLWQEVITLIDDSIPSVTSSYNWQEVNLPFQNKHTNVGYPYYRNDRTVDPKTNRTYGEITNAIAKKLKPVDVVNYPYIAFGRNLRKKARPILGGSRIQALVFNQLETQEIKAYRESSPLFIGYNDDKVIKSKLIKLGEFLQTHKHLTCMNRDFSQFDTTVRPVLRRIVDAISVLKVSDKRGQDIAYWRGVSHAKSLLVNGLIMKIVPIYSRIFSGELDTNRGGGLVNAIAAFYVMLSLDPSFGEYYYQIMAKGTSALMVMGDDNLLVQPKALNNKKYSSLMKSKFGLDVSDQKGEFGLFFLQRRLFQKPDGKWIMVTPFTRVIRSLISKENRKGLGPAGWTVATYQLLYQLIEWPELMIDVAKIFARYDEYKLGTVWTVKQMTKMIAEEDKNAAVVDKRSLKTAIKLNDGDPLKQSSFKADGSVDEDFLTRIHKILSKAL